MTAPHRKHRWTAAELAAIRQRYPNERCETIARDLGRTLRGVYMQAKAMGVRKSAAFLSSAASGRMRHPSPASVATQFKPGQAPWNKGRKGWQSGGRSVETQFQPGQMPRNTRALGETRLSKDGTLERKYSTAHGGPSARWRSVHRMVWEAANGPMPRGYRVCFRPGMRTSVEAEITLDRLELLSFAQIMARNSYHTTMPPDVARLYQLKGVITRQLRRIEREALNANAQ